MGKPTKPRVKGNMKPASRANPTANPIIHSRPTTPSDTSSTDSLDPELVVILKKISKRDSVTKLKALEELDSYLKINKEVIGRILNNWAIMYSKLVLEVDRRVRLAANQVHALITADAKKKLAPLLKEFIGPWLLAMHDQSKDVAKVAQHAFEGVFAQDKRLGVISFCQKEILDYTADMLLYKTAETLSDSRYVSKEDMYAKYARVVSSSYQILCYLITNLPLEERNTCQAEYNLILDDSTMWKKFLAHDNALVRKALYMFMKILLLNWVDMVESRLDLICPHFYPCVFTEKDASTHSDMWDTLLLMTKKLPNSWIIIGKKKPALPKLYNFLRSGLNGSTSIAYPSMLALLANLPQELRNAPNFYKDVFDNFWKGLSSEHIDKSNSHILLNAYAECVVYFAITLSKSTDEETTKIATSLVEQIFWGLFEVYFLNSRDKTINEKLELNGYAILAKHLVVLASVDSVRGCLNTFYTNLDGLLVQTVVDCSSIITRAPLDMDTFCQKTSHFLTAISHEISQNDKSKLTHLQSYTLDLAKRLLLASIESSLVHKDKSFGLLLLANQLLSTWPDQIINHDTMKQLTHTTQQLLRLFIDVPDTSMGSLTSYYITFISQLKDKTEAQVLWKAWMQQLNDMFNTSGLELRSANILLLALERLYSQKIVLDETYQCEALDSVVKTCALVKLNQVAIVVPRPVLEKLVSSSLVCQFILSANATKEIFENLTNNLIEFNKLQYIEKNSHTLPEPSVQTLKTTLSTLVILQNVFVSCNNSQTIHKIKELACEIFDVMFVSKKTIYDNEELAKAEEDEQLSVNIASRALATWGLIDKNMTNDLFAAVLDRLKTSIIDIHYSASPSDSVRRAKKLLSSNHQAFAALVGNEQEWNKLAAAPLGKNTTDYLVLGIVDPFARVSVEPLVDDVGELMPVAYDIYGLSSFGRLVSFFSEYLSEESHVRFLQSGYDWVMRQLEIAAIACQHGLIVPGLCRVYDTRAVEGIHAFVDMTHHTAEKWLVSIASSIKSGSGWNDSLLQAVQQRETNSSDRLISFISQLILSKDALSAHLLQSTLQRILLLLDWQTKDVEKWLPLIKADAKELNLLTKVAILNAFKGHLSGTEAYKHYQSELASRLSGISSWEQLDYVPEEEGDIKEKTNYSVLVLLNTSSLKFGAFDIPRQRIMYLIQGIRPLLTNEDDEFSNDQQKARVQAQYANLLKHLAESVQDVVSGSHWDFFLQCCFKWMGYADTTQPEELLVVQNALDLLKTLYALAADNNEDIQDSLKEHASLLSKSLVQLMIKEEEYLQQKKDQVGNKARLVYQTLLSELLENIPDKTLIDSDCFSHLNALIQTPNDVLQKRAYSLLQKYVAHRIQDLSVRLEFTEASEVKVDIDEALLDVLLNPPDLSNWQLIGLEEQALHETLGYLLTWMLMFDHFTDITFKLKQEYTAQLKEKEAVSHLMAVLCKILSVGQQQGSKPFDLSPWSVIEYDIDGFDATLEMSFIILASHLYYRALTHIPSLVRLWWIDCKHRQLTIAIENYTEKHFSQQLINNEMELVNRPDIKTQLEDNEDNEFTVKTSKAANEVTATYRVDEQNMQIAIKLPSNFPLRQIDVEGVQKVGVNDKQWRGWMFAVTAVIGSQVSGSSI
ncbi:uncharacterized protein B0P05DRAFT_579996 [Gilbertella persicaria]|uniref:uncharacterized protein n=1 Tax=Gilbertella persicaria TaxID=101096 RepID=UPI0022211B96|nr:uncharacterized protein B0P05DRAFT_579996 [Gilbertella persicaria]KAI8075925.1 hypothetical protein B0P05DRAFT_579996 [Gilbertella persicaria]